MWFASSREPYAKRSVPVVGDSILSWARQFVAWQRVEAANVERATAGASSRTVTTSVTASAQDGLILADATGGAITVTLPDPKTVPDLVLCIKRLNGGGNAVTVGGTVDGTLDPTLASQYESMTVWAHVPTAGTGYWYRIATI